MENHIFQVLIYLAAVIGMILFCGYLLKVVKKTGLHGSGPIKIVASMSLGLKDKLVLIQVGESKQLLLAVSPGKIEKLQSFEEPVIQDEEKGLNNFKDKLQEIMNND